MSAGNVGGQFSNQIHDKFEIPSSAGSTHQADTQEKEHSPFDTQTQMTAKNVDSSVNLRDTPPIGKEASTFGSTHTVGDKQSSMSGVSSAVSIQNVSPSKETVSGVSAFLEAREQEDERSLGAFSSSSSSGSETSSSDGSYESSSDEDSVEPKRLSKFFGPSSSDSSSGSSSSGESSSVGSNDSGFGHVDNPDDSVLFTGFSNELPNNWGVNDFAKSLHAEFEKNNPVQGNSKESSLELKEVPFDADEITAKFDQADRHPVEKQAFSKLVEQNKEYDLVPVTEGSQNVLAGDLPPEREVLPGGQLMPLGFEDQTHFNEFVEAVYDGLENQLGIDDATVTFQGSAVSGFKMFDKAQGNTGKPQGTLFDSQPFAKSDLDIGIASEKLFAQAEEKGIPIMKGDAPRTPPLDDRLKGRFDGMVNVINNLQEKASQGFGETEELREVNFMIFRDVETATERGSAGITVIPNPNGSQ